MFKDGDVVCFFGDSITAKGTYIQRIYNYYLRTLNIKVKMYNFGVPGDCAKNAADRVNRVLEKKPAHVVMMFGMNDVERDLYCPSVNPVITDEVIKRRRAAIDKSVESQKEIANIFISRGVNVIFCRPTLYDEERVTECENNIGVAHALYEIGERVEAYAKSINADIINYSLPLLEAQRKAICIGETLIGDDRVHPNDMGHIAMAKIFLAQQGANVDLNLDTQSLKEFADVKYSDEELRKKEIENILKGVNYIEYCLLINAHVEDENKDAYLKEKEVEWQGVVAEYIRTYFTERGNRKKYEKEIDDITDRLIAEKNKKNEKNILTNI